MIETCVFCKKGPDIEKQVILLTASDASICSECVETLHHEITKIDRDYSFDDSPEVELIKEQERQKPSEIVEYLNQYVVGQDHAKRILAVAITNHYKMLQHKANRDQNVELQKSNILLVGPTGSGKTYILSQIAKMINVPFASADATTLTEAG